MTLVIGLEPTQAYLFVCVFVCLCVCLFVRYLLRNGSTDRPAVFTIIFYTIRLSYSDRLHLDGVRSSPSKSILTLATPPPVFPLLQTSDAFISETVTVSLFVPIGK